MDSISLKKISLARLKPSKIKGTLINFLKKFTRILTIAFILLLLADVTGILGNQQALALNSNGPRNSSGGCSAEFGHCESLQSWLDGGGGGGGGGGATRRPGTGCDLDSNDFRDIANWKTAKGAVQFANECSASGGEWEPTGNEKKNRLVGIICRQKQVIVDELSTPTTLTCFSKALEP